MKRLPVLQILSEGLDSVWANRMALFVALVPISLIWVLYGYVLYDYVAPHIIAARNDDVWGSMLLSYGMSLLSVPIFTVFAVTVHRLVLIGNQAIPWYGQLFFSYRELKFCVYVAGAWLTYFLILTILTNLLSNAIEIPSASETSYIYWIWFTSKLLAAYPLARISLSFPAIAVDYFFGLKKTWRLSKGNSLRLYLCVTIVPTLFWFLMRYLPGTSNVLIHAFYSFMRFVMFAVEIAILSASYKWLVHSEGVSPSPAKAHDRHWPVIGKMPRRLLSLSLIALALILLAGLLYKRSQVPQYHSIKQVEVALQANDFYEVQGAIQSLQDFPRHEAVPLLNKFWKHPEELNLGADYQLRARVEIARVLLYFSKGNRPEVEKFVFEELSSPDPQVKDSAILALVYVSDDKAVDTLRSIIVADPQSQSAEWAFLSLETMAGSYPTDYPLEVMEQLEKMQKIRASDEYGKLVKAIAETKADRDIP